MAEMIGIIRGRLVACCDLPVEEGAPNARLQPGSREVFTDPCLHPLRDPRLCWLVLDEAVRQLKFAAVAFDGKAKVGTDADRTELKFSVGYFEFKHFRTMRKAPESDRREIEKMPI